jgi:hypothetical protein
MTMTDQMDNPPAPAKQWFYWIAYSFTGGAGATEASFPAPITHGGSLVHLSEQLARNVGSSPVVVTGFTLLRVEDTGGQEVPRG